MDQVENKKKIVQTLVDYGVLELEEGKFNPGRLVSGAEVVVALENTK